MKCKVFFVSPKGCAESIAGAIAHACDCPLEPLLPAYMPENLQLMFLGCEGNKADKVTMEFISSLGVNRARNAALFCCGGKDTEAIAQMKAALEKRGVNVVGEGFIGPMKTLFGGGGPKDSDLQAAAQFAAKCMQSLAAD